jgi:hypothetical protein
MAPKGYKITTKLQNLENSIIQDILIDLKKKAYELEGIAREFQNRMDKEGDIKTDSMNIVEEIKCDLCIKKFKNISSLEKHIKCDYCDEIFVMK